MSLSLNKVVLAGFVGKDPEGFSNNEVAKFSMATREAWKDKKTGEWMEETQWHDIVLFGYAAKKALEKAGRGSQVYIEGKIKKNEWEKDGVKYQNKQIIASVIQFLDQPTKVQGGSSYANQDYDNKVPF